MDIAHCLEHRGMTSTEGFIAFWVGHAKGVSTPFFSGRFVKFFGSIEFKGTDFFAMGDFFCREAPSIAFILGLFFSG